MATSHKSHYHRFQAENYNLGNITSRKFENGSGSIERRPSASNSINSDAPSPHNNNNNDMNEQTQAMTIMQLRSVLNDGFVRGWIFVLFGVQLIIFILQPVANFDDYRDTLNNQYDCNVTRDCNGKGHNGDCTCDSRSMVFFVITEIILRLFVPITLISTLILVVSFEKKFYVSRLDALRFVLSPSSIAILFLISLVLCISF